MLIDAFYTRHTRRGALMRALMLIRAARYAHMLLYYADARCYYYERGTCLRDRHLLPSSPLHLPAFRPSSSSSPLILLHFTRHVSLR